jgi:hypothetical protein
MFNTTKKENALIHAIAKRAAEELGYEDVQGIQMDLEAAHTHDCPLNFRKLLAFPPDDFAHDVSGINKFLDRDTLKLTEFFLPRCSLPDRNTDDQALEAMESLTEALHGLREDERKIQEQASEYACLIEQLSATGIWTPAEQVELVELQPYFVRLTTSPEQVMITKWTNLGWDNQEGEPGAPATLEVLVA